MAELSITASAVLSAAIGNVAVAGAEIQAGQLVYVDSADANKAKLAANDTAAKAAAYGMAMNHAYTGQPVSIVRSGEVTISTQSANKGDVLVVGNTAGKLMPVADLGSSDYVTHVGYFKDATTIVLSIVQSGLLHVSF